MTKLYIPALGDRIKLTADWTFLLFPESRNMSLYTHLKIEYPRTFFDVKPVKVTLPAGTELGIDRIYIRRGNKDFDSITFNLLGVPTQKLYGPRVRVRFWAKLAAVNTIEFESLLSNIQLEDTSLEEENDNG
jgi:hypothetical protein